jgi:Phage tail assembly chaperone protein, TAC
MTSAWAKWLSYGCLTLGLTPKAFWDLSLSEWIALSSKPEGGGLLRAELSTLMQLYPDRESSHDKRS